MPDTSSMTLLPPWQCIAFGFVGLLGFLHPVFRRRGRSGWLAVAVLFAFGQVALSISDITGGRATASGASPPVLIAITVAATALLVVHIALFVRCRPHTSTSNDSDSNRNA